MGEVLNQVWLKSIKIIMSESLDKQVNAHKEKNFQGFTQAPASPRKSV